MKPEAKRILLIVDGSDQSFDVVRYAGKTFNPETTAIVLFHVMDQVPDAFWDWEKDPLVPQHLEYMKAWETQKEQKVQTFMEQARQMLLDADFPAESVTVSIQKRKEGVARDILNELAAGYTALILGRKGQSTVEDQLMGSVASKILARRRSVPIGVVGGKPKPGKVLIGMDNSKGAQRAVELMATLLQGTRQAVTLLHVVRTVQGSEPTFPSEQAEKLAENAKAAILPALERAARTLTDAGIPPSKITTKVVTGASSRTAAILKEALSNGCGTIAVGRRGVSDVEEFEMGRVAGKLTQIGRTFAIWVVR